MVSKIAKSAFKLIFSSLLIFLITVLLFFLIEGFFSTWAVLTQLNTDFHRGKMQDYDDYLGWKLIPNLKNENWYGHQKSLTTNSQSFRNEKDFNFKVPANKIRIVCSGDSFTFGSGVGDKVAWCNQFNQMNDRIEAINMGESAYSVGQAYLKYVRDGEKFDHHIHIFAFITHDFRRMKSDKFLDAYKPVLGLKDGKVVVTNYPVPKRLIKIPNFTENLNVLARLDTLKFLTKLMKKRHLTYRKPVLDDEEAKKIVSTIFQDLKKINEAKNSVLVLVLLPLEEDRGESPYEDWRQFVHAEAAKQDIIFIDLVDNVRQLSDQEIQGFYTNDSGHGHLAEKGNHWVIKILSEKLFKIPAIAQKLSFGDEEFGDTYPIKK